MRHLRLTSVRLDEELLEAMSRLRERDGIQRSEQVRRGLRQFLEAMGVIEKSNPWAAQLMRHDHHR